MIDQIFFKLYKFTFHITERVLPTLAAKWAVRIFCTVRKFKQFNTSGFSLKPSSEQKVIFPSQYQMEKQSPSYVKYRFGKGKKVLLIHGWEGRASQMDRFIKPLVDAGFEVWAIDLPAHGNTLGRRTNLPEMVQAILHLADNIGKFHTILAHSFGGVVAINAIKAGVKTENLITIGTPASMKFILSDFKEKLQASDKLMIRFREEIENFIHQKFEDFSPDKILLKLSVVGLIVHDRDDKEVDYRQAVELHEKWPESKLILTRGLGHRRILRNRKMISQIIEFVQELQKQYQKEAVA